MDTSTSSAEQITPQGLQNHPHPRGQLSDDSELLQAHPSATNEPSTVFDPENPLLSASLGTSNPVDTVTPANLSTTNLALANLVAEPNNTVAELRDSIPVSSFCWSADLGRALPLRRFLPALTSS